jgi:hypothetical protein
MGDIEVGGKEKPAAIWEDTYYTFIIIKIAAFTYKNMFYSYFENCEAPCIV